MSWYILYIIYNYYKTTINLNQLYVSWIAKPTSYCCWARISNFGTKITLILPPSIEFFNFWSVKYFDLLFMSQAAGRCFLTAPSAVIVCRFLNWNSSDILNTSHKISSKKIYVVALSWYEVKFKIFVYIQHGACKLIIHLTQQAI